MAGIAGVWANSTVSNWTLYTRIAISASGLGLLLVHRIYPKLLPTDAIGLGLLVVILLPWIAGAVPVGEVELLGVKLKLKEVADEQKQHGQTLAEHDEIIGDLVAYGMSASIFRHLCGITLLKEYNYEDNEANRREFYFLRDNGFIAPKSWKFLEFNQNTPRNVCEIAGPTPIGRTFVRLRKKEIPIEWLTADKAANLAVDPAAL